MTPTAARSGGRVECGLARQEEELALHHLVRHSVFVAEQGLFDGTDVDEADADPATLKVLARSAGGAAAGAVRLRPVGDGLWHGDRLAVLPPFRGCAGRALVRCATSLAAARGGREMRAYVQLGNVRFFERLGWVRRGSPVLYAGLAHQPMGVRLEEVTARAAAAR